MPTGWSIWAHGPEPLRAAPGDADIALPPKPLPEPDIATAARHEVTFTGGMMGAMVEGQISSLAEGGGMGGVMGGGMMGMRHDGRGICSVNGVAAEAVSSTRS